jgi:CheY-like chemotaxis protein
MHALIVDDSPTARTLARIALDEAATAAGVDFDVDEADGGIEALRVLASSDVDLLIVDLHMPGIHGLEVLAFWHRRGGRAFRQAIVVSTQVSGRDREKALELGTVHFVEKPVSSAAIAAVLASVARPVLL